MPSEGPFVVTQRAIPLQNWRCERGRLNRVGEHFVNPRDNLGLFETPIKDPGRGKSPFLVQKPELVLGAVCRDSKCNGMYLRLLWPDSPAQLRGIDVTI